MFQQRLSKATRRALVGLGISLMAVGVHSAAAETLTLEHAIQTALENNPEVHRSRAERDVAQAGVDRADAAFRPRVSVGAGVDHLTLNSASPAAGRAELDFSEIFPDTDPVTVDEPVRDLSGFTRYSAHVTAEYILWDFGQRRSQRDAAIGDRAAAQARTNVAEADTVLEVAEGYFDLLHAQALLAVQEEALARQEESAELARRLHRAGRVTGGDVARADADVARAEVDVTETRNTVERHRLRLLRAMGVHPHNAQFEVDTRSRIRAPGDWRQALEDKDWAEEHPSVVAQIEAVEARRAELERHRRSFRPTLQAGANYRVDRFAEGGTAPNYTVGVELRWDIFDGGDRGSRVAEARAQQMSAAAAREHRYNEVVTQAREAENDLAEAEERIQLAQRALAASEEDLRNARGGYREGVRSFSDLSQAQVDVAEAQARLEGARFDRQKALARLYWALGSIPTDTLR